MNLLDIRTWADVRSFLHVFLPALAAVLAVVGYVTSTDSALWLALLFAVIDGGMSSFYSASKFRAFLYPALVTVGALLVRYGVTTTDQWALWSGLVPVVFGGGIAAANVRSTGRHARLEA